MIALLYLAATSKLQSGFPFLAEYSVQDSSSPNVDEEQADHDEQRSPSPQIHTYRESNTYGSDNFEENDDSES